MPEAKRRKMSAESRPVRPLPSDLVDQIAAGEVVERPASVVKELVENALDAGAGQLRIEVRDGGRALLAVTDDGCGMAPEDARMALERHATSKLASAEDLSRIQSFGFRGEALPAIASVSRFRLRTRPHGAQEGFEISVEAGRVLDARAAGGPEGTRIEVADLFAALPARRKFLKSASTEWGHIADWLARAALALPEIHFEVQRDERKAWSWPACEQSLDRIAAVLSEEDAAAMVAVEHAEGELSLSGFASRPERHRASAAGLYLYVNGRPVRDRLLRHAAMQRYRDVLPRGRFPTLVLFLEVPSHAVDVNVHPAKWEVRFAEPRAVHHLVTHGLEAAVTSRSWLSTATRPTPPAQATGSPHTTLTLRDTQAEPGTNDWVFAEPAREPKQTSSEPEATQAAPLRFADLRLLGQLLGTYLVCEAKDGLLLVDQHAAHERVLYERLRAQCLADGVASQGLLVPENVELEAAAVAAIGEASDAIRRFGFDVEPFGETTVVVRALPALLAGRDPSALVRSLADEVMDAGELGAEWQPGSRQLAAVDHLLATLACHSARRAGDVLTAEELQNLLEELDQIPWAPTCPHGRPVASRIELPEIERRFSRR